MTTTTAPQAPTATPMGQCPAGLCKHPACRVEGCKAAKQARALAHYLPMAQEARRFQMTSCSQCGADTGPGDAGFSSCTDHLKRDAGVEALMARLRGAL